MFLYVYVRMTGADENSYKLAPATNFALASWWLDRAHFDKDPQKTPFTRPGKNANDVHATMYTSAQCAHENDYFTKKALTILNQKLVSGEFGYQDARTCCGVNQVRFNIGSQIANVVLITIGIHFDKTTTMLPLLQVFHPCGCRVGSDISTCAAVGQARGFGQLIGSSPITPEKVPWDYITYLETFAQRSVGG